MFLTAKKKLVQISPSPSCSALFSEGRSQISVSTGTWKAMEESCTLVMSQRLLTGISFFLSFYFFLHLFISKPRDKLNIFSTEIERIKKDTTWACANARTQPARLQTPPKNVPTWSWLLQRLPFAPPDYPTGVLLASGDRWRFGCFWGTFGRRGGGRRRRGQSKWKTNASSAHSAIFPVKFKGKPDQPLHGKLAKGPAFVCCC